MRGMFCSRRLASGTFGADSATMYQILIELRQAQGVAIRIAEPCYPRTASRCRPDAVRILPEAVIYSEGYAFVAQSARGGADIGHLPTQNRVRLGAMAGKIREPGCGAPAQVEGDGKVILADDFQSEYPSVKGFCPDSICRQDEADWAGRLWQ